MNELTNFLSARIAEDEEWARWAGAAQDAERSTGLAYVSSLTSSSVTSVGRVLARCAAERRIVVYAGIIADDPTLPSTHLARHLLADLASVYADHPDYREEWKP